MVHNIFRRKGITEWLGISEKRLSQLETDTKLVTPVSTPVITQTESNLFESTNFAQCSDNGEIRINNTTTPTSAIDENTNAAVKAYNTFDEIGGSGTLSISSSTFLIISIPDQKGKAVQLEGNPKYLAWDSTVHPPSTTITHVSKFLAAHSIRMNSPGIDTEDRKAVLQYNASTDFDLTNSISVSLWFYPTDTSQIGSETFRYLLYRYINATNHYMILLKPADQKLYVFVNEAGAATKLVSSGTVNLNAWNLIIFTYNPSTNALVMYLNNSSSSSAAADAIPTPWISDTNLKLASMSFDAPKRFTCYLDDFVFWTGKILTGTEATNMWNHGTII